LGSQRYLQHILLQAKVLKELTQGLPLAGNICWYGVKDDKKRGMNPPFLIVFPKFGA
jgi:hypothetical protein